MEYYVDVKSIRLTYVTYVERCQTYIIYFKKTTVDPNGTCNMITF